MFLKKIILCRPGKVVRKLEHWYLATPDVQSRDLKYFCLEPQVKGYDHLYEHKVNTLVNFLRLMYMICAHITVGFEIRNENHFRSSERLGKRIWKIEYLLNSPFKNYALLSLFRGLKEAYS